MDEDIYIPAEDSLLLAEQVRKYAFGKVLDMGTGSGILAVEAADNPKVESVIAVDKNKKAVKAFDDQIKKEKLVKIDAQYSDLFSSLKSKKFDTIVFNPPYLPQEGKVKDKALVGGIKGYEVIEKFMKKVSSHLKKGGMILLLFSSLTGKRKVEDIIKKNKFKFEKLSEKRIFLEDLFVYKIFGDKRCSSEAQEEGWTSQVFQERRDLLRGFLRSTTLGPLWKLEMSSMYASTGLMRKRKGLQEFRDACSGYLMRQKASV